MIRAKSVGWIATFVLLIGLFGAGSGCGNPSKPAPTVTISIAPTSLIVGGSAVLTWSSTNATSCTASGSWSGTQSTSGTASESPTTVGTDTYTLTCMGAGGSASGSATLAVTAAATQLIVPSPGTYRHLGQISLGKLDPSLSSEMGLTVSLVSGPTMEYNIGAGNVLYYLAPEEQYGDTTTILAVSAADGKLRNLVFNWHGRVSASLTRIDEGDGDGAAEPSSDGITLNLAGVGAGGLVNSALTTSLTFSVGGGNPLDPSLAKIILSYEDTNNQSGSQDVSSWFTFDATTQTFTLVPGHVSDLLALCFQYNRTVLAMSLPTADYADAYGFEQALVYANASISAAITNADGSANTSLAGTEFVLQSLDSGLTALQKVAADGTLNFSGFPAGTYALEQVLLSPGTALEAFPVLETADAAVQISLVLQGAPSSSSNPTLKTAIQSLRKSSASRHIQRYAEPPSATHHQVHPQDQSGSYTQQVTAGAQDTLITQSVSYTAPTGTKQVSIHVDVFTEEYPVYTGEQSIYNDVWNFNLQLPGNQPNFTEQGKVNATNADAGTISYDQCVTISDPSTVATISGTIGAENVADDQLPTSVTVTIAAECSQLTINNFDGVSKTSDGSPIIRPIKVAKEGSGDGNLLDGYFSLPLVASLPQSFGIPAEIDYSPSDATLTDLELFQRGPGGDVSLGLGYLSQADTSVAGIVSFKNLLLNPTALSPVSDRIQIVAVLHGMINGTDTKSDPYAMIIDDYSAFTPLYLTSELPGYPGSGRRFGTHDEPGGDSWCTNTMCSWLFAQAFPYNDISAAHVKQKASGRSVLDHSGHSDGQQVDVRYYSGDTTGPFSDPLSGSDSGAALTSLAAAALQEVKTSSATTPNLTKLVTFIQANRSNMDTYAASGTVRRIYIGLGPYASLLKDGKFPGTKIAVPGISPWSNTLELPQANHLNHWHISTLNP